MSVSFLIICSFYGLGTNNPETEKLELCSNFITISGSTNVSSFELENTKLDLTKIQMNKSGAKIHPPDLIEQIQIPVKDFNCKNKKLCKDFRELVNEKQFPFIYVDVVLQESFLLKQNNNPVDFIIKIGLSGENEKYSVPCNVFSCGDETYIIKGQKEIKLSDFQIDPPKKIMGLVKVKDEVFINFSFKFVVEKTN